MSRTRRDPPPGRLLATLVALVALAGCFLPQPLTEVANTGTVATPPPRIVTESIVPSPPRIDVSRSCSPPAAFTLQATIHDDNPLEPVDARWFVDYSPDPYGARPYHTDVLPPPVDSTQAERVIPPLALVFPDPDPATVHVVELVVSNGFYILDDPAAPVPNRSAQPGYETQVFRWVFSYVDTGGACR